MGFHFTARCREREAAYGSEGEEVDPASKQGAEKFVFS